MFRYLNFHHFSVTFSSNLKSFSLSHEDYGKLVDQVILVLKDRKSGKSWSVAEYDTVETNSETTKVDYMRGKENQTFGIKYVDSQEKLPTVEIQIRLGKDDIELRSLVHDCSCSVFEWQGISSFGENQAEDVLAVLRNPIDGVMNFTVGPAVPPCADALFNRKDDTQLCFSGDAGLCFDYDIGAYRFTLASETIRLWVEKEIVSRSMCVRYNPIRMPLGGVIPCGFMTWYALKWDTSEKTVVANIEAQSKLLKEYGANTVWIDWEWYHCEKNKANNSDTFHPNPDAYPNGLKYIADLARGNGMIPALWCSPTHEVNENEYMRKYPDMLLTKQQEWCGEYFFDPTNPNYLNVFIPAVFNKVKEWGYQAVKWDTLPRSLDLYDDYHDKLFDSSLTSETALRIALYKAREVLGEDVYMLSCSGENDRVVTACSEVFNAARIGADIFEWKEYIRSGVARLMKYYPMHNTMLLCDADNLVLREKFNTLDQAVSRASLYSIMGAPINIGDDLTQLSDERLSIYKRILPTIRVRPTELTEKEIKTDVLVLNSCIRNPWESYHVADVFNTTEQEVQYTLSFESIGLKNDEKALVYDFWNEKFLGICEQSLPLTIPAYGSLVLAIRKYEERPQLVSVSRHVLQGAYEIGYMKWEENTLSGEAKVVSNDACKLRFYIPDSFHLQATEDILENQKNGLIELALNQSKSGNVKWALTFEKK